MNSSMGFLKPVISALGKYKALLPSIAITVVALLLFLMTMLRGDKIKKEMTQSVRTARSTQSLLKNIPSRREPKQIEIYMDKLEEETNKIKELAAQSSQRDLITYNYKLFPEPVDQSQQIYFGFGKQYRIAIEELIKAMNALDAPSQEEIRNKTGGGRRPVAGSGGHGDRTMAAQDPRVDALCLRRAREVSVYVNPSAFAWYPFWESYEFSGKNQALEDCWDSQMAFWVYEDIADTIEKTNSNIENVLSAPVKRLLGVRFTGPVIVGQDTSRSSSRTMGVAGVRDKPNYVSSLLPSFFLATSPTGRVCNDDVDIIHFAVSVLIDSHSILSFMKELCNEKPHSFYPDFIQSGQPVEVRHNQITILQSDLKVIDKSDSVHELYRYGKGAVVRLDLICEYQFNRSGYDAIKPEAIKKRYGQPGETQRQNNIQDYTPGGAAQEWGAF